MARPWRKLAPGPNAPSMTRLAGRFCYLRIKGVGESTPWAFERASIRSIPKGRRRLS